MEQQELLKSIISELDFEKVKSFLRLKSRYFTVDQKDFPQYKDDHFDDVEKLGEFAFDTFNKIVVFKLKIDRNLSEKTSKKLQYDKAKDILKQNNGYKAGMFFFYDKEGNFRLSLVYEILDGNKRKFNLYKRFTYFVRKGDHNQKTFIQQIGKGSYQSFRDIKDSFSVDKLSNEFYNAFEPKFTAICNSLRKRYEHDSEEVVKDFVLLFVIRIIFLGFIQKKKWLSESEKFLQEYWAEYKKNHYGEDRFYSDWLNPLFFRALNNPPGSKNFDEYDIPDKYKKLLEHAPYLNGGLFDEHRHDNRGYKLLDSEFEDIFEYIYSYNFTIEENTLYDHELELNPEFLGIIFEKLVNKELGAVYTPRTEVDFMGRLTLVKWLYKNNTENIELRDLYELFFDEIGTKDDKEDYQKEGSFSRKQIKHLLELLIDIKVCDPACGSGAFLVGMLQILDDVEKRLRNRLGDEYIIPDFERRKQIVFFSLFGVEVKEWAVWIAQLRLWITLFIEAPDSLKESKEAILPSLDFKIRKGDSLVQKVGSQLFSIKKFGDLGSDIEKDVAHLIHVKREYYDNKFDAKKPLEVIEEHEKQFFTRLLEVDIKRLEKEIEKLKSSVNISESQASLFGESPMELTLDKDAIKTKLKDLEEERKDIVAKLGVVNKERPLIWIVEFADVFADPNKGGFDIVIGNPPYLSHQKIKDPLYNNTKYKDDLVTSISNDFPSYFRKRKVPKKSNLYTYFYVRSLALLNEKGITSFICQDSWLDLSYGVWLQKFLLANSSIKAIISNDTEKSFKEEVNTIISLIEKEIVLKNQIKFINIHKPLESFVFTENLMKLDNRTLEEDLEYRLVTKTHEDIMHENEADYFQEYKGDKWGSRYLRAPGFWQDLYIQLVRKAVPLSQSEYRLDGYVHDNNTGNKYSRKRFIKNIRGQRQILLTNNTHGVIDFGVKEEGGSSEPAPVLFARTFGEYHVVLANPNGIIGKEFYKIYPPDGLDKLAVLFMNSTLAMLQMEIFGNPLGGGGLKFSIYDVGYILIPNNLQFLKSFIKADMFLERTQKTIYEECGYNLDVPFVNQKSNPLDDRRELDNLIFDYFEIDISTREKIYSSLCTIISNRMSKSASK